MNGELALDIWLAAHGTHYLRTGQVPDPEATVFEHVGAIRFERESVRGRGGARPVTSPQLWLEALRDRGATRIELDAIGQLHAPNAPAPPVAFANSLRRSLSLPDTSERWSASWTYDADAAAIGRPPWHVTYYGVNDDRCRALEHPDLPSAREVLEKAVDDTRRFALSQKLDGWVSVFERSLTCLIDESPEIHYYEDLLPETASTTCRQLVAAAASAWVFGRMGSWNDLLFDGDLQQSYEKVTRDLLQSVMYALDAAVNSEAHR